MLMQLLNGDPLDLTLYPPSHQFKDTQQTGRIPPESRLTLYTSGTAGASKRVTRFSHGLQSKTIRGSKADVWLLTFNHFRWGGVSQILHCIQCKSGLAVPQSFGVTHLIETALEHRCTHLSVTPSLFKKLLLAFDFDLLRKIPISQITFSGEYTSQAIIDEAKQIWGCRVTQVYALTEVGDLFSCSDGQEGFPIEKLSRNKCRLAEDGELIWDNRFHTGDFWKVEGDRFYFQGRDCEMVNIGAETVSLVETERLLLTIPGVFEVIILVVPNALVGNLLTLEYTGDAEPSAVFERAHDLLPKSWIPREIRKVERIDPVLTSAGKRRRLNV